MLQMDSATDGEEATRVIKAAVTMFLNSYGRAMRPSPERKSIGALGRENLIVASSGNVSARTADRHADQPHRGPRRQYFEADDRWSQ